VPNIGTGIDQASYSEYAACILDRNFGAFAALYTRHLRAFPAETGDIDVTFLMSAIGSAQDIRIEGPDLKDVDFHKKIAARLSVLQFAAPATPVPIRYTFKFSAIER